MAPHVGQQAVVIGGSMAGLMTARVLADHFDAVTVIERDHVDDQPTLRQSIPQGSHLHGLLLGGQQVMASLYPGFVKELETLGAARCRAGTEVAFYLPKGKAFSMTGTVQEPCDLGFDITCQSRGLLEYCVRHCILQHANIAFAGESTVHGLVYADGCIRGVHYTHAGDTRCLAADLVVDAGGRRSQTPRWLTALGCQAPEATTIVDRPWTLAAVRDFAYPRTRGERPTDLEEQAQYFADVDTLTAEDIEVQRLVTEVLNLAKPFSALQEEPLRSRVEAYRRRH